MRHSIPHWGHLARSAPSAGRKRSKQVRQRTSPSRGPSMTLLLFIALPPGRIAGCEYLGNGQPAFQIFVRHKERILTDNNRLIFPVKIFFINP
jgi:hypothetical protein